MLRSLHHNDPMFSGGLHVHVVHARPRAADDLQVAAGVDDVGRHLG